MVKKIERTGLVPRERYRGNWWTECGDPSLLASVGLYLLAGEVTSRGEPGLIQEHLPVNRGLRTVAGLFQEEGQALGWAGYSRPLGVADCLKPSRRPPPFSRAASAPLQQ